MGISIKGCDLCMLRVIAQNSLIGLLVIYCLFILMILNSTIMAVISVVDFYNKVFRLLFIFKKYLLYGFLEFFFNIFYDMRSRNV